MLTDTINKVKNVSIGYVGSNGLFDSATVNAYTASLRGLSETQARVVLSSTSLDKAQKQQILNKLTETNATISLTSAEATEALTRSLGSKEAANELLVKSGLVTEEQLLAGTTIEVTSAKIADAVATGALTKEEGLKISTALGLTSANVGLGTSFKLLGKQIGYATLQMLKWLVATPAGWATIAIGAIVGTTVAIVNHNKKLEEARQEMIETGKEATQLTKDLDGLIEQYRKLGEDGAFDNSDREQAKNIQQQINELLGESVGYIDLANGSYEEQLGLLKKLQLQKANETYADKKEAKQAAEDSLLSKVGVEILELNGGGFTNQSEMDAYEKFLKGNGFSKYIKETDVGDIVFQAEIDGAEDAIEVYDDLVKIKTILSTKYEDEIEKGGELAGFYEEVCEKVKDWSEAVQKYKDALGDYELNKSVIEFNETDFGGVKGALIENEEQLKSWINAMLDSNDISDGVKENLIGLANVHLPQYGDAIKETIQAHVELKAKSLDSQNVLDGEVGELYKLGVQSGLTNKEIVDLISTQIIFNNTSLNIAGKVQALAELATQLGVATSAAIGLNNALAGNTDPTGRSQMYNTAQAYGVKWDVKGWSYNGTVYKSMGAAIQAAMAAEARGWVGGNGNGGGGSGGGGNKGSGSDKNKPDYEDPTDAIINRINLRADELAKQEEEIQNLIEIAELEKDYKKQISLTNDLIATRKQRVDELNAANAGLHNEAESLRSLYDWDEESWFDSQGNATEAYYTLFNSSSKEDQEVIKDLFDKLSKYKKAWVENSKEIADINNQILQDEKSIWDTRREIFDKRLEEFEYYIEHSNDFGWENGDNEVEARKHILDWIQSDYCRSLIKDDEEYYKILEENRLKYIEAQKGAMEKSISDIEDYIDARNHYNDWDAFGDSELKAIQRQTKIIEDAYKQRLLSTEEYVDKLEEYSQRIYSLAQEEVNNALSKVDRHIDARNFYDDWEKYGYTEVDAIKEKQKIIDEAHKKGLMSYEEYVEKTEEIAQEIHSAESKYMEESLADIDDYINSRNFYNDWADWGDSEVDAINRKQEKLDESYEKGLTSLEEYTKESEELIKDLYSLAQEYLDKAFSDIDSYIDDRNFYDDWEKYGDSEIEAIQTKQKILDEMREKDLISLEDYTKEIENLARDLYSAEQKIVNEALSDIDDYINDRNFYDDWDAFGDTEADAIMRKFDMLNEAYEKGIISVEEYVDKTEELAQYLYSIGQEAVNKSLSDIDKYINARNFYDDWEKYGDSEIEAIQAKQKILDEIYKKGLISLEEYIDAIEECNQQLYSVARDNIIKTISEMVENYVKIKQDEKDALSFESTQYSSLKTLLQSHYNVTNAIAEAQHEINKELRASKSMYEYLNKETRKLLFNQEDYDVLNEKLLDIQAEANALQEQYNKDILGASKETIAEITSQYQMQYETLMKQYDIAKAELDVAKKRQKLDNVIAERNVRMFIDGEWQWVADTQKVIEAENELADAEIAREQKEASLNQVESLIKLQDAQDDITTQINYLETDLEKVRNKWSEMQKMLKGESEEVAKVLNEISTVSSPEFKKIIEQTGGDITSFSGNLSESITAMSGVINKELDEASKSILLNTTNEIDTILSTISDGHTEIKDKQDAIASDISTNISTILSTVTMGIEDIKSKQTKAAEDLVAASNTISSKVPEIYDTVTGSMKNVAESIENTVGSIKSVAETGKSITDGIGSIITNLGDYSANIENYSKAIESLVDKINNLNVDKNGEEDEEEDKPTQKYNATATLPNGKKVDVYINSAGKTTTPNLPKGTIVHTGGGDYKITGGSAGNYTSEPVKSSSSSSSSKGSSSGSSGGKTVQVGFDGNAPSGTKVGDTVKTAGGNYLVVPHGTPGSSYNPVSGLSSIKVNADGSRYTSGGLNLIGEEGFEAYISNNGHLIPINQPTLGNIGAGGIVFNQEQMANLRNLWDLSNMGKISPLISSSNMNKQDTIIDNSIHINGLVVNDQGNEDWINGLRRYVATHR